MNYAMNKQRVTRRRNSQSVQLPRQHIEEDKEIGETATFAFAIFIKSVQIDLNYTMMVQESFKYC